MKRGRKYHGRAELEQISANLRAHKLAGTFCSEVVRRTAEGAGVSDRRVHQIAAGLPALRREAWALTPEAVALYYDVRGRSIPKVHRRLRKLYRSRGECAPSLRTVQRAFATQMGSDERAFARLGLAGLRQRQGRLLWEPANRNAVWQTDHVLLKVPVKVDEYEKPQHVWMTYFLDCFSRLVMGWVISHQPSEDSVLEALRESILVDEGKPFGGRPDCVQHDNGLEFLAQAVQEAAGLLDFWMRPIRSYASWLNGKIERCHRTLRGLVLSEMPGWSDGPRDETGTLYDEQGPVVTYKRLVAEIEASVAYYNFERPHQGIDGLVPFEKWLSDKTPLRLETPERLRFALRRRKEQTVDQRGVYKHGRWYYVEELGEMIGERVIVAWLSKDERFVDVYTLAGKYVCSPRPQKRPLSQAEVIEAKRLDRLRQADFERKAAESRERGRIRFAPSSRPEDPQMTTVIDRDEEAHVDDLVRLLRDEPGINDVWRP